VRDGIAEIRRQADALEDCVKESGDPLTVMDIAEA
jgi:hypothetical protein